MSAHERSYTAHERQRIAQSLMALMSAAHERISSAFAVMSAHERLANSAYFATFEIAHQSAHESAHERLP